MSTISILKALKLYRCWPKYFSWYVELFGVDVVDDDTGLPLYYDLLQSLLHPAGIQGFFEKTETDYIPPDDYDGGWGVCESPRLGNYFPYRMKSDATIAQCFGCNSDTDKGSGFTYAGYTGMYMNIPPSGLSGGASGWGFTYGDGWAMAGDGSIPAEFEMPTFAYPFWADGITSDINHRVPFENIYIGDFVYLCPIEDSPNLGITGCTAYSDVDAGPCWR